MKTKTMFLMTAIVTSGYSMAQNNLTSQLYNNDKSIINKRPVLVSAVIGASTGILLGSYIGLGSGSDTNCSSSSWGTCSEFSAKDKAIVYSVLLGIAGGTIGVIIGSLKKKSSYVSFIPLTNGAAVSATFKIK